MTDNILRIRTLCDRFFDGATTLDEEQQLYAFFSEATVLPDDLADLRPLFVDMAALPQAYADPLPSAGLRRATRHRRMRRAAAAAVVVALSGGALLCVLRSQPTVSNDGDELVAYVYGERSNDPDVVLTEMHTTMAALHGDESDVVEEQLKAMFDN